MTVVTADSAAEVLHDYANLRCLQRRVEDRIEDLCERFDDEYYYGVVLVHDSEEWGTRNLKVRVAELERQTPVVVCDTVVEGIEYVVWYCLRNSAWYSAPLESVEVYPSLGVVQVDPECCPLRLTEVGEV